MVFTLSLLITLPLTHKLAQILLQCLNRLTQDTMQQVSFQGSIEFWSPQLLTLMSLDRSMLLLQTKVLLPEESEHLINWFKSDVYSLGLTFLSLLLNQ